MPRSESQPLAFRMAPRTLAEYVGQRHILAEGKLLRRMIQADQLSSIILHGPPGTGKTSLAKVIANSTAANFVKLNAVTSGVKDLKRIIEDTANPLLTPGGRTVLFIDEIHRFNRAQQDALLPSVEEGSIILIGATTENPYFEVNKALISRSTVFRLEPLGKDDLQEIIEQALQDVERGYGDLDVRFTDKAMSFLLETANGDARVALNALSLAVTTTPSNQSGYIEIDLSVISECLQQKNLAFDKDGEAHYDTISALIKSMRGSDPDAAIHYLARALASGEDINFIARRLIICAAEDVGLASPQMLTLAVAGAEACRRIGMPEARIILAEVAVAIATSPKSNSTYLAIDQALADVKNKNIGEIPFKLRNAPIAGMAAEGYGRNYRYAHNFPHHYVVGEQYLPDNLSNTVYYQAGDLGYEQKIKQWYKFLQESE